MEPINIERFIEAQDRYGSYNTALQEIKNGRKRSHWIWYVFPQMRGLGYSSMSQEYGISSLSEAKAYWNNPILHDRLLEITEALLSHMGDSIWQIFGKIDAMKVRSCMTLFDHIAPHNVFREVIDLFYNSRICEKTLSLLKEEDV